jgi:hypothetical protein
MDGIPGAKWGLSSERRFEGSNNSVLGVIEFDVEVQAPLCHTYPIQANRGLFV